MKTIPQEGYIAIFFFLVISNCLIAILVKILQKAVQDHRYRNNVPRPSHVPYIRKIVRVRGHTRVTREYASQ